MIGWERLEISSRKLEIPSEHFMKRWDNDYRSGIDLTETEDIKRWQEYTEELYKKDLQTQIITMVWSLRARHECEVKWALGSITTNKAGRSDGVPIELFQILKDDAVTVLHSICQQIWKIQQWPQDWKRSVFIPIPKKEQCQRMLKLPHNCTQLTR